MLRFHPSCYYRDLVTGRTSSFPALIATVTDRCGLDPGSIGKAQVDTPRRALGGLLGNAVRFRFPVDCPVPVMVAGEGLESILSLSHVMPACRWHRR